MKYKVYYRTSENFGKNPPHGITEKTTFQSLLLSFEKEEVTVICDNCTDNQFNYFKSQVSDVHRTSLGNCGSYLYQLELSKNNNSDVFYFVESDHLHLPDQKKYLSEGLQFFDIVSLYDHPDKYFWPQYAELKSKIFLSQNGYWRTTPSTVMTFSLMKKTLLKYYEILTSDEFINIKNNCPLDMDMFTRLEKLGVKLGTPLPGKSTHLDIGGHSPYIDWTTYGDHINKKFNLL
jgi:hypothetical protein